MLAGVIFDLDGTLVDSLEDIGASMNAALARFGLPAFPIDAYKMMVGDGAAVLARRATAGTAVDPAALADVYAEEYEARDHRSSRPYPGIDALLAALVARGVVLAVLSNKPDAFTRAMVRVRLADIPFRAVYGQRTGVPRKPDPAAALAVAVELGLAPAQLAFVGDTAVDIATGRAAGMLPVGVLWGFRGRDELEAAGARHVIARPAELLEIVGGGDRPGGAGASTRAGAG
ncbi:MAG TPA: HAD family hydrolase [Kofleriaceae bacterium]|nr:HAD family hydrolase [Kofleriaceae bacterium]